MSDDRISVAKVLTQCLPVLRENISKGLLELQLQFSSQDPRRIPA